MGHTIENLISQGVYIFLGIMTAIEGYQTTYEILKAGSGNKVDKGRTVTVHALGVVKETGKKILVNQRSRPETFYIQSWCWRSDNWMGPRPTWNAANEERKLT